MISESVVELSRWQFAITALYHFLFVPLTLGLSLLVALMESCYVITQQMIYKQMTQFWGKLWGINFSVSVATGLAMEFQFGMNWSYFSLYVGDIFGAPLALAGLSSFFLQATLMGVFFWGWDKLTQQQHLIVTWLLALSSALSALLIVLANGWLQHPQGFEFNDQTMRLELLDFASVVNNTSAWIKFAHTLAASYLTAAGFVLAVSSYYLLKNRDLDFAKRSYNLAAVFGLLAILSTLLLGHESLESVKKIQPPKFAALAINSTANASASAVTEILRDHRQRIQNGIKAYALLEELRDDKRNPQLLTDFARYKPDLGYGLLLKAYTENVAHPTATQIEQAVQSSIPKAAPLFWSVRIMIGCGFALLLLFIAAFVNALLRKTYQPWLLKLNLYTLPLPWIAAEMGWFVSEFGRQPWSVSDILPTFLSASSLSVTQLLMSITAYVVFFTFFLIVELLLMLHVIKQGLTPHSEGDAS